MTFNTSLKTGELAPLSWIGIFRLGLVQTAFGAIIILTTSTLNRIMVVEHALPAVLPGALVSLHYAIQISRPRWGYGSDMGGRRTPWIIGGMAVLGVGGALAAIATAMIGDRFIEGLLLAILAFALIGVGVGAAGTSLLALMATRVAPKRRPAAASMVWIMMIAGFIVTAIAAGAQLDPYTPQRLIAVCSIVSVIAFVVACLALIGVEGRARKGAADVAMPKAEKPSFMKAFSDVWREPRARQFTLFVFVSMLAYSAQDLILEPFAGLVFNFTPGESTKLAGVQNGGAMTGMIMVAIAGSAIGGRFLGSMRGWAVGGCVASALAFVGLAMASHVGPGWPLRLNVFLLGLSNGAFAVAAIGSMMGLANQGEAKREGTRMGVWGASQAVAFGLGGFLGTMAIDIARALLGSASTAYTTIFIGEAILFIASGYIAMHIAPAALAEDENADSGGKRGASQGGPEFLPAE